jgi:hypothetical protein
MVRAWLEQGHPPKEKARDKTYAREYDVVHVVPTSGQRRERAGREQADQHSAKADLRPVQPPPTAKETIQREAKYDHGCVGDRATADSVNRHAAREALPVAGCLRPKSTAVCEGTQAKHEGKQTGNGSQYKRPNDTPFLRGALPCSVLTPRFSGGAWRRPLQAQVRQPRASQKVGHKLR